MDESKLSFKVCAHEEGIIAVELILRLGQVSRRAPSNAATAAAATTACGAKRGI